MEVALELEVLDIPTLTFLWASISYFVKWDLYNLTHLPVLLKILDWERQKTQWA